MDIKKIRIAAFEDMDDIITAIEKILDNIDILRGYEEHTYGIQMEPLI